jgi:lysophospholipase L1-like esterase
MMALAFSAAPLLAAPLEPKDVKIECWNLTLQGQTVTIEPTGTKPAKTDGELKAGTPNYGGPQLLGGASWAYQALRVDTLVATPADKPEVKLAPGKDFALNADWASVAAIEGSAYPAGTKVKFEYQYGLSRMDLIEKSPDGKLVVRKGVEDKSQPLLPEATPGNTPLAGIYLGNGAKSLTKDAVCLIDPSYDGVPPVSRTGGLKAVKDKMASGKPVTIVFLGDSITAQQPKDMRDGKGSFIVRFTEYLRATYPQSTVVSTELAKTVAAKDRQIVVVMSGVGGNNSTQALKRIDTDVLAHKPDLVVVMLGVNDENRKGEGNVVPVDTYKSNLEAVTDKVQASGGQVILMTTSMKNLGWETCVGNLNEYAAAAREVSAAKQTVLVDHFSAWEQLPKRGYHSMVFLGNCLNHPVDLGHDLFFRGLKEAFED